MPAWEPNWTDVRFDQVAAEQAASVCERAARVVRATTSRRDALIRSAVAGGRGPWRDDLEQRGADVHGRAEEVESRLRALAVALREASERARIDQNRRIVARQQWVAESNAEAERSRH